MISELSMYSLTIVIFVVPAPILWKIHQLSTLRTMLILFVVDIVLTIEAALYGDIVAIAILHVFTIPALIGLLYFDLVKEHKSYFTCFICGKQIEAEEEIKTIKKLLDGKQTHVLVHTDCIELDNREKKTLSSSIFKKGIPK